MAWTFDDFLAFRGSCTNSVLLWLAGDDDENPVAFRLQRYSRGEAKGLVLGSEDADAGAQALRDWFADRLTIDPGTPGPFGDLAYNLISTAVDLIDWARIVAAIRDEDHGEEWRIGTLRFGE